MIELSSINNVSLVTGSIRDDPYWTSKKNSLEPIKLSNVNLIYLFSCSKEEQFRKLGGKHSVNKVSLLG